MESLILSSGDERVETGSEEETIFGGMTDGPRRIGRYLIDSVLGEGAMGIVYKGFDTSIQRHVAIKTIRAELLADAGAEEFLARFRREAQAAGRFVHPNVVAVFEFGEDGDIPYLALEYVAGRELKVVLGDGMLSAQSVLNIFRQVLAGLQVAHEHGVVHRDIKPQNIFVLPGGLTKVADFGIARLDQTGMTRTGTAFGTPSYMSPEQFKGSAVDARSDLYSAAAVLYEMIAGAKAFPGTSITEVMYAVLEKEPRDLLEYKRDIPEGLVHVVGKGLAKHPDDRFQSAQEFTQALDAAYAGTAIGPGRSPADTFESSDALTSLVLPTLQVGLRDFQEDIDRLLARRLRNGPDAPTSTSLSDTTQRLDYAECVTFARALRANSAKHSDVLNLAQALSNEPTRNARRSELLTQLTKLASTAGVQDSHA
jgi:serine/threonine protein kinase